MDGIDAVEGSDAGVAYGGFVDLLNERIPLLGGESSAGCVEHGAHLVFGHNVLEILLVEIELSVTIWVSFEFAEQVDSDFGHLTNFLFKGHLAEDFFDLFFHVVVFGDSCAAAATSCQECCCTDGCDEFDSFHMGKKLISKFVIRSLRL